MQDLARDLRPLSVALIGLLLTLLSASVTDGADAQPTEVDFPTSDGGEIHGLLYGDAEHVVVLAHGMVFDKYSWEPLATALAEAGFAALAIDFRGYGASRAGSEGQKLFLDVVAAMSYAKALGATRISVLGASMGGGAAARAAVLVEDGEIDRLILLAPSAIPKPEQMHANRLVYLTSKGDPSIDRTRRQYEMAPEPKTLEILPGEAHAQHLFKPEHAPALIDAVLAALRD